MMSFPTKIFKGKVPLRAGMLERITLCFTGVLNPLRWEVGLTVCTGGRGDLWST